MSKKWFLMALVCCSMSVLANYEVYVFEDINRNGIADPNEPAMADIIVSNYSNIVLTDENGDAKLPKEEGYNVLWVHEPTGYRRQRDIIKLQTSKLSFQCIKFQLMIR